MRFKLWNGEGNKSGANLSEDCKASFCGRRRSSDFRFGAEAAGFSVEFVAADHSGAGLAREFGERNCGDEKCLLPRSDRANPDMPAALRRCGAIVTEVVTYRKRTSKPCGPE